MKSITEASKELGVSRSALYKAIERGTLVPTIIGGMKFLSPEQINKYREVHLGKKGKRHAR